MKSELRVSSDSGKKSEFIYSRPLSGNERVYLAGDKIQPPFCVQLVVEGTGDIDINRMRLAVEKASDANPGSRVILKGFLNFSRWIDTGLTPPVREADGREWSGFDFKGTSILQKHLSVRTGPVCEVVILRGDPVRIVFRGHHSVMDGQGLKTWVEDIFRALRGEELTRSDSCITDFEMLKTINKKEYRESMPTDCLPPTGMSNRSENGYRWIRRKIDGVYPAIVAQFAALLAVEAREHFPESNARFMIPVDLRPHQKGLKSTGNVSNPIYLEVKPGSTWKDVNRTIINMRFKKHEALIGRWDHLIRFIPLLMLSSIFRLVVIQQRRSNRYPLTGILSHLGSFDTSLYSWDGFISQTAFFLPVHVPIVPIFIGVSEESDSTELIISINNNLGDAGRLDKIADYIISQLKKSFKDV